MIESLKAKKSQGQAQEVINLCTSLWPRLDLERDYMKLKINSSFTIYLILIKSNDLSLSKITIKLKLKKIKK